MSEDRIRELAYLKWEQAGYPAGDGVNFWVEAEKELASSNGQEKKGKKEKAAVPTQPTQPAGQQRVAAKTSSTKEQSSGKKK